MTSSPLAPARGLLQVRPRARTATPGASLALAAGLAAIVVAWVVNPVHGGDTGPLLSGTEALGRCLGSADLVGCDDPTPIGPYPLLQHAPDLVADAGAELGEAGRRRVLASLSILGVVAAVAGAWYVLRRVGRGEQRWVLLLVVLCGPVLAYGGSTWGEMPAAGSLVLLVAAALVPAHPVIVALAGFVAALTKETGYPFVLAFGLAALLLARQRTGASVGRHMVVGLGGLALGVAASSAFNLLRFGTPKNAYYLDPALRNATPEQVAERAAALFVSPNGGVVLFWPLAFAILAGLTVAGIVGSLRGDVPWRAGWPGFAIAALWICLTGGLATWWSPFGWWAWGPRLSLPWILPMVLLVLAAFRQRLNRVVVRILGSSWGLPVTTVVLVGLSLPHVGFLWDADDVIRGFFLRETAHCPGGGPPPTPAYDACLGEQMWVRRPIWLDALAGLRTPGGILTSGGLTAAIAGSLVLLRQDLSGEARPSRQPLVSA